MAEPATAPESAQPILRLGGIARRFGELFGRDVTAEPARRRARMGLSRTFQTSRLFGGLTVEDNVYLAVLGVRRGHLRPVSTRDDDEMREHLAGSIGHQCPNR
jgi:ABC-type branched-subunit amino acid transport system ATPase component